LKGLRLSTLKQDGHGDLRDSDCRSVIPYVYGRELDCCVCMTLFKAKLNMHIVEVVLILASAQAFYSSKHRAVTLSPKA
jgi:hypothetical protein